MVTEAFSRGAAGYITKDESLTSIIHGIRKVALGEVYVSSSVMDIYKEQLFEWKDLERDLEDIGLNENHIEVLKYLAHGHTNTEIAEELFRSERTVRFYMEEIREKTEIRDRSKLVAWAWQKGIAELPAKIKGFLKN